LKAKRLFFNTIAPKNIFFCVLKYANKLKCNSTVYLEIKPRSDMKLIIEILLMGAAVALAAFLIPGVEVSGFLSAIIAGILIALANATIGTILRLLTFPINILTLGIMSFIITVLMVLLVDSLMDGFNTSGFFAALLFAIVLALIKMIFGMFNRG
jgi:putative membrane protein